MTRRELVYHIVFWIVCFVFANYGELRGYKEIVWPVVVYRNVASFTVFYIFWWLGIHYHRHVNVLTERTLSGGKLIKYRFLNWPFFSAFAVFIAYMAGGIFIDGNFNAEGTTDEIFMQGDQSYQSRVTFGGASMLIAYIFTLRIHVRYVETKKYKDKLKRKLKVVIKDRSGRYFNLN